MNDTWQAAGAPNVQINLAGEWDTPFVPGLTLDGRIIYTGTQYVGLTTPRLSIPDWVRFDIGARYVLDNVKSPTGKPVAIRFNVENVLDTNYWSMVSFNSAPQCRHAAHLPAGTDGGFLGRRLAEMETGFRASMNWLHTWAGVVLGGLLFAIFWMGTLSVFDREIDRWMAPMTRLPVTDKAFSLESLRPSYEAAAVGKRHPGL